MVAEEDEVVAQHAFKVLSGKLEELKSCAVPLPYGRVQHYSAVLPTRTPDDLLSERSPWWWAVAEVQREYAALLAAVPKQEFRSKAHGHQKATRS